MANDGIVHMVASGYLAIGVLKLMNSDTEGVEDAIAGVIETAGDRIMLDGFFALAAFLAEELAQRNDMDMVELLDSITPEFLDMAD